MPYLKTDFDNGSALFQHLTKKKKNEVQNKNNRQL